MIIHSKLARRFQFRDGSTALDLQVGENDVQPEALPAWVHTQLRLLQGSNYVSGWNPDAEQEVSQ
jgi:hypothetical protein